VSLASGHLASFDRRKCKVLRGPTATGAAPADAPTWTIKAQAARPLFIAPPPQPAARSREDAIARARSATCLIEVTR